MLENLSKRIYLFVDVKTFNSKEVAKLVSERRFGSTLKKINFF